MATKTTQRAILPSGAESVNFLTNTSVKSVNNLFALKAECIHLEIDEYDMYQYMVQMGFTEDNLYTDLDIYWNKLADENTLITKAQSVLTALGYTDKII